MDEMNAPVQNASRTTRPLPSTPPDATVRAPRRAYRRERIRTPDGHVADLIYLADGRPSFHLTLSYAVTRARRSDATATAYLAGAAPTLNELRRVGLDATAAPHLVREAFVRAIARRANVILGLDDHGRANNLDQDGVASLVVDGGLAPASCRAEQSALRNLYRDLRAAGLYLHRNPFVHPTLHERAKQLHARSGHHASDNWFRFRAAIPTPPRPFDPDENTRLITAAAALNLPVAYQLPFRLMDHGLRVAEATQLTVGGVARGTREAPDVVYTRNKGDGDRPVKRLALDPDTLAQLRAYLLDVRPAHDPHGHAYATWARRPRARPLPDCPFQAYALFLHEERGVDPDLYPVLLTSRGTGLTPNTFRHLAWQPTCARLHLKRRPHDMRINRVSADVRLIEQISGDDADAYLELLNAYREEMRWRDESSLPGYLARRHDTLRGLPLQRILVERRAAALRVARAASDALDELVPALTKRTAGMAALEARRAQRSAS